MVLIVYYVLQHIYTLFCAKVAQDTENVGFNLLYFDDGLNWSESFAISCLFRNKYFLTIASYQK